MGRGASDRCFSLNFSRTALIFVDLSDELVQKLILILLRDNISPPLIYSIKKKNGIRIISEEF